YDDGGALTQARWHAVEDGVPLERIQRLPDGGIPPRGSTVFGLFQECDYVCHKFATWQLYWLATAVGPRPGELPRMETDRVEAFSDGVFAIAITLLILPVGIGQSIAAATLTHQPLPLSPP